MIYHKVVKQNILRGGRFIPSSRLIMVENKETIKVVITISCKNDKSCNNNKTSDDYQITYRLLLNLWIKRLWIKRAINMLSYLLYMEEY